MHKDLLIILTNLQMSKNINPPTLITLSLGSLPLGIKNILQKQVLFQFKLISTEEKESLSMLPPSLLSQSDFVALATSQGKMFCWIHL
jgi:hypothetical protein